MPLCAPFSLMDNDANGVAGKQVEKTEGQAAKTKAKMGLGGKTKESKMEPKLAQKRTRRAREPKRRLKSRTIGFQT